MRSLETGRSVHASGCAGKGRMIILLLAALLLSCIEPLTPERRAELFNKKHGPEITKDSAENMYIELPFVEPNRYSAARQKTSMRIPKEYEPRISGGKNRYVIFKLSLENLTDWDEPPPIPPDVEHEAKIYNNLIANFLAAARKEPMPGLKPETRERIHDYMEYSRKNKLVRYLPDANTFSSYSDWREFNVGGIQDEPGLMMYMQDGKTGGLERYSRKHCFTERDLRPDPDHPGYTGWKKKKYMIEHKRQDDPSPDMCFLQRLNARLINTEDENRENWVYIDCSPVLQECTASAFAGNRMFKVDFYYKDLALWRETVDPARLAINGFMTQ